jgi:hypothetical protein
VKQAPILGRLGESLGKGLSEMLPEELAHRRRAQGLKSFSEKAKDLDPMQSLAEISSVYGVTPQMLQSFAEMARLQQQKKAYENSVVRKKAELRKDGLLSQKESVSMPEEDFAEKGGKDFVDSSRQKSILDVAKKLPWNSARRREQSVPYSEEPVREISEEPFLDERTLPKAPWTPSERDEKVQEYVEMGFLPHQARELAADDEKRFLASSGAYQARLDALKTKSIEAQNEFKSQLEKKLQKTGEGVYKDITGEMLSNLERGLERDLRSNPNLSVKASANEWSRKALDLAKTKKIFDTLAKTTGIESLLKGNEVYDKLTTYSKIFSDSGNSEEYYNLLKSRMGLSPQSAAYIAYPTNKNIEKYISSIPSFYKRKTGMSIPGYDNLVKNLSQKAAMDIEKMIEDDDSILSIAKSLSNQVYNFSERDFFNYLRRNIEKNRLNKRQKREIAEGESGILTNWADIKIMPIGKQKRD